MDPKQSPQHGHGVRTMADDIAAAKAGNGPQKPPVPRADAPRDKSLLSGSESMLTISEKDSENDAVIVTDKQRRPSILGALKDATTEIAKDTTHAALKPLTPPPPKEKPKVTPGSERKDVVTKAVTNKLEVPKKDHESVLGRVRTLAQDAERVTGKPFVIRKREEHEAQKSSSWSHFIGKKDRVIEAEKQNLVTATVTKRAPDQQQATPSRLTEMLRAKEEGKREAPKIVAADVPPQSVPEVPKPAPVVETPPPPKVVPPPPPIPVPEPIKPTAEPEPQRVAIPQSAPEAPREEKRPEPQELPKEVKQKGPSLWSRIAAVTSRIAIGRVVLAALGVMLTVGIIGSGVYYMVNRTPNVPVLTAETGFFKADEILGVPLVNSRTGILTAIQSAIANQEETISQIVFTVPGTQDAAGATTADFFAVLSPRINDAAVRTLDARMMVGGVQTSGTHPYIILKTSNFDVAFAGMLEWEANLSQDLAPLYGQGGGNRFIDRQVAGKPVRVLYDTTLNAQIVYGFVNRNTIIITTTEAAFAEIIAAFE